MLLHINICGQARVYQENTTDCEDIFPPSCFFLLRGETLRDKTALVQSLSMVTFEVWTCIRREAIVFSSNFPFKKQTGCHKASSHPAFSITVPNIAHAGFAGCSHPLSTHKGSTLAPLTSDTASLLAADLAKTF